MWRVGVTVAFSGRSGAGARAWHWPLDVGGLVLGQGGLTPGGWRDVTRTQCRGGS